MRGRPAPITWFKLCTIAIFTVCPIRVAAEEPEEPTLRPGLSAVYRSIAEPAATFGKIDAKPAFFLGHSSLDPRLPASAFEVVWKGRIDLVGSAPVAFDAFVCGELKIEIDGVVVLEGRGENETATIGPGKTLERAGGVYPLRITYRSLADRPARIQIWWRGPAFTREPLPAWRLKHEDANLPDSAARDQLVDKGRDAARRHGCARCHQSAFPGIDEPSPGPSLGDARQRISRDWLLAWLDDPSALRAGATMAALFSDDRTGFIERWIIADHLLGAADPEEKRGAAGDHRQGRKHFIMAGCTACHFVPDVDRKDQPDLQRTALTGLRERLPIDRLAAFLANPLSRYPDGRMPTIPLSADKCRDIATYLLENQPAAVERKLPPPPAPEEIAELARRMKTNVGGIATALMNERGCVRCHTGLGQNALGDIPLKNSTEAGCLAGKSLPRFPFDAGTRKALSAYVGVASREQHPSPFAKRQRLIEHLGCARCHQRDSDRPSPLEIAASTLGGAFLQNVPFQKAPRLTNPHQKFTQAHLRATVANGVAGLRFAEYSYRMPAFGAQSEVVVQALAEADGELPDQPDAPNRKVDDPTLGPLAGSQLAGFQGYSCVSCHVWNGKLFAQPDPGAIGTDLTRIEGRIRRDWFDRYLEGPARLHPGTPMPAIFTKDRPATLRNILEGDAAKQKDALWSYFALGKNAPAPKPSPPLVVAAPQAGEDALVGQIPLWLPDNNVVEAIAVLSDRHDLFVYDLGSFSLLSAYTKTEIQREVLGRIRKYRLAGDLVGNGFNGGTSMRLRGPDAKADMPRSTVLHGYDRLNDGVRVRWSARYPKRDLEIVETIRLPKDGQERRLRHSFVVTGLRRGEYVELPVDDGDHRPRLTLFAGKAMTESSSEPVWAWRRFVRATANEDKKIAEFELSYPLPPAQTSMRMERVVMPDSTATEAGERSLSRPGYQATAYPRPKTERGDDLVMPGAVAVHPIDGRVFVACMKTGTLYELENAIGDGKKAVFKDYARGLFQETYSMLAENDALYVLHRRNLTRVAVKSGGPAERFDRVFAVEQAPADAYDYGYGLVRDTSGAFVFTQAPHANRKVLAAGNAVRLFPDGQPKTFAYGFRNPLGWCTDTRGDIYFTDNQGDWVATNKLCRLEEGKYYGYPNRDQKEHASRPAAKTTVWVPYGWAKSINGVTCDTTGGKFGPFAGQFFLAELMFGGALIRADVEEVNGVAQGVCFPFWGRGLLGPLTLAFDPKGPLYVGSITEPGWMAQPDRGALYRIDFTGQTPFEMKTIRVLPDGFRILLTRPASANTAGDAASYKIESFRYESTGAYGSPELDRAALAIKAVKVAEDGMSVDVMTGPLTRDRVYMIDAGGVRSREGEALVQPIGAYTLNEIPTKR